MAIAYQLKAFLYAALILVQALAFGAAIPARDELVSARAHWRLPMPMRLMTFNIRYAASPSGNEQSWSVRQVNLIDQVAFEASTVDTTLIGMQEVLNEQLNDILTGLHNHPATAGQDWTYVGVGRDDGKEAGEYSPIFYRKSVWELLHFDTKWVSETPDVPSYGWGAGNRRIVTIAVLRHRATGQVILAMNTHLDDSVSESRLRGAEIILEQIHEYKTNESEYRCDIVGVTLTGDFNSEEDQEAYITVTDSGVVVDPVKLFPDKYRYGNRNTFSGFNSDVGLKRIDYIFLGKGSDCRGGEPGWETKNYAALPNKFDDGVFFSDHRAVLADAVLG